MADIFVLFTVLALIIAILQILPKSDVIELRASLRRSTEFRLVVFVIFILFFMAASTVFDEREILSGTITASGNSTTITVQPTSIWQEPGLTGFDIITSSEFYTLLSQILPIALLVFCVYLYSQKKEIRNVSQFVDDLDELYAQENYSLFFRLFESHYEFLLMIKPMKTVPATKGGWKKRGNREAGGRTNENSDEGVQQSPEINAETLAFVRRKFSDQNFIEKLALLRPDLGVRISFDDRVDRDLRQMLIFEFYRVLLKKPDSILHRELSDSMELRLDFRHRYKIPRDAQIIPAIFANLADIQDLGIIKAFGETTIELIKIHYEKQRGRQRLPGIDTFNDQEVDPIITGFRFFDLIVTEALYQKIRRHMWLYYYTHFTRAICAQFPELDLDEHYARNDLPEIRYLHEIVFTLIRWIEIAEDEPDKIDLSAENGSCADDNGSIIKSSVICLSQCINEIIRSNIPDSVKVQLVRGYLEKCLELRGSEKPVSKNIGCAMARCFLQEGDIDRNRDMKQTLYWLIGKVDTGKLLHNPDGKQLHNWLLRKTSLTWRRRRSVLMKNRSCVQE